MSSPTRITANDLRVVVLTPAGRGAVATVLVSGPAAMDAVAKSFQPLSHRKLTAYAAGDIVVGNFVNANGTREELVVGIASTDRVEIHCHGGRAAVEAIVETLGDLGGRRCPWKMNPGGHSGDSIRAEAMVALAQATTERAAGVLLDQYRGALCEAVQKVVEAAARSRATEALALIDELLGRAPVGLHLTTPWWVAIAGRPNVGKSSLINALVGYERAIVFDQPGTTRDVLTARTALDGWPVELLDTAGLRNSIDPLESAGIERAQGATAGADLALVVFEASAPWTADDRVLLEQLGGGNFLVVYNKLDLGEPAADGRPAGVAISARSGTNLNQLTAAIAQRLVPKSIDAGMAVPFTQRQVQALTAARAALAAGDIASAMHQLRSLLETNSAGHSIP